jgi:hypothetical protein
MLENLEVSHIGYTFVLDLPPKRLQMGGKGTEVPFLRKKVQDD